MKTNPHLFIVAGSICLALATTSCDNEYDLTKDIDTNVNIGKNFTIPVGQTVEIPVSRIIKPGDNITIDGTTGIYSIEASGNFESDIKMIEPFTINGLYPDFVAYIYKGLPQSNEVDLNIPIPIATYASYEMEETRTELPKEVDAVYFAEFNGTTGASSFITITLPTVASGSLSGINSITMKNVTITFPDIFILNDGTHKVVYPELTLSATNNFTYKIPVTISRMELPADRQSEYISEPNANGCRILSIHEKIDISAEAVANINPSKINSDEFELDFKYEIQPAQVTAVNGVMSPDVSINETLEINDLPEFIDNDENSFAANDITFSIDFNNPIGMALETSIIITPWDKNTNTAVGTPVEIAVTGNNAIKPNGVTKYVISNTARTVEAGTINLVCPELPSLTSTIPNSFKITNGEVVADGTNCSGYTLGEAYRIEGKYNANVPMSFDSMNIYYTDFVDGLHADLEDVADLTDKIILTLDAVTTIPTDLEAEVELYDGYGNKLNEIIVTGTSANKVFINGSSDGTEKTTPLTITIEEKAGSTQLEELEKVVYTIKAANADGKSMVLKSSQYLILKNGVAKIPNGITTEL